MKKNFKEISNLIYLFLAVFTVVLVMAGSGCSWNNNKELDNEFITVDVFSAQANYQGIQTGWFAKVIKDKFNMELNIIAPNVAGGGDTLYQTRAAAGEVGDIIMIPSGNGRLEDLTNANLLMDLSSMTDLMPNIMSYPGSMDLITRSKHNNEAIYAIPSALSSGFEKEPIDGLEPTFGPYIRWDLYSQIGYPEIETLEDLLPILKEMQTLYPTSEKGEQTYAFSLFGEWDDNLMMMAKQPTCFYGYDELGFLLNKADGSHYINILDDNSPYLRSLEFYFKANQLGLVDPDSMTQTWDDVWNKYVNGSVLFSPWPWLGQAAYNTLDNMSEGKGFMLAPLEDMNVLHYGVTPIGSDYIVAIGSNAEYPERIVAFIDWLYSAEGIMMTTSQTGSTCGPEGLTWKMVDGNPVLTEFGISAMLEGGTDMPAEWGGGSWNDGVSQLNFLTVLGQNINPETNYSYDFRFWDSYIEFTNTPLHDSWINKMNAKTTFEYLKNEERYVQDLGVDYVTPSEPIEISTIREKCKKIIVSYSWKMVFATNKRDFEQLLIDMQEEVEQLGYSKVIDYDIKLAKEVNLFRD